MNRSGDLGVIAEGALADLIALDGDPLKDLAILTDPSERIPLLMRGGSLLRQPSE